MFRIIMDSGKEYEAENEEVFEVFEVLVDETRKLPMLLTIGNEITVMTSHISSIEKPEKKRSPSW